MRIIETKIPDIEVGNLDKVKIDLAERVAKNIKPLFDEAHSSKQDEIKQLKSVLQAKKRQVLSDKETLEKLVEAFNRKKKVKELLEKVSKLVSSGILIDGNLKRETIILLKVAEKLSPAKINSHLQEVQRNITKRFSKI